MLIANRKFLLSGVALFAFLLGACAPQETIVTVEVPVEVTRVVVETVEVEVPMEEEPMEEPTVSEEVPFAKINDAALAKFDDGEFGGTLVIGKPAGVSTLDPHLAFLDGTRITLLTNEGAVARDRAYTTMEGFDEPGTPPMYSLAESIHWEGDSTLVFKFREGVTFHDGTPFNAEAALFNYRRIWDPTFEYYYPEAGASKGTIGPLVADEGRAMEVRDEYTLAIELTQRTFDFLDWMNQYGQYDYSSPTAIMELGNEAMSSAPVGTGPFKFVEWIPNDRVVLEANDDYWGGRPFIDEIVFLIIPDAAARMTAILNGEVDVVYGVIGDFVDQIEADPDLTLYTRGIPDVMEIGPNYAIQGSPLQDAQVRKALSLAIDREGMSEVLLRGTWIPAASFSSPSAGTFDPTIEPDEFDLEESKRLLTEAGYPDGFELNFLGPTSGCGTDTDGIAEYVQSTWSEVDVTLNLQLVDIGTFIGQWLAGGADPSNAEVDLMMLCMGLDTPFRIKNALSRELWSPAGWNSGHYYNPEVEALLTLMTAAETYEEYIGLARQAEAIARGETSQFWTVWDGKPMAVNNRIQDWVPAKAAADVWSKAWLLEE